MDAALLLMRTCVPHLEPSPLQVTTIESYLAARSDSRRIDFMLNSALCEVTVTQTMDADMDDSDHSNHHPDMEFDHRVSQSLSRLTIGSSTQAARDGARVEQARGTSPNKTLTKSRLEIGGVTRI
ncbi:hypothetical protein AXG93_698s1080 [Marchantia polymorpha subsp. ruderalis]|uniref:Uncharacterized protein n=1 Tax=Marchantia polymorpha subsp. ruderalis TaxID=1480154 RepID=A0A176VEQ6_MARPO|nr:hypothetical protein AXG93_698s1080 [Marchantia polymorpha subsp. ruderalis]